jgi:hypothetical protein
VTALYGCATCGLMFRMPKGSEADDAAFYQHDYEQGGTTEVPTQDELKALKLEAFAPIGRDYTGYIEVLRALGLAPGDRIYDYGASWGYGSWQFTRAGFSVYSYEISRARSRYAERYLDCNVLAEPVAVPEPVACFFASHVLEHLGQPHALWRLASQVVGPGGLIVLFMPNGEPARARRDPGRYHQQWGRVHPLLLTATSVGWMAAQYGFEAMAYSSPYDIDCIARHRPGHLDGDELLVVARRCR